MYIMYRWDTSVSTDCTLKKYVYDNSHSVKNTYVCSYMLASGHLPHLCNVIYNYNQIHYNILAMHSIHRQNGTPALSLCPFNSGSDVY